MKSFDHLYVCHRCGIGFVSVYGMLCWTCRPKVDSGEKKPDSHLWATVIATICLLAVMALAVLIWTPRWFPRP